MSDEQQEQTGTDLEVAGTVEYTQELDVAPTPTRTVDMRDRVTDSWTDVLLDVGQLTRSISDTELVPEQLRGRPGAVGGVILKGRELGLPPMTALSSVFSIKGQLGMKAETMRALILQRGHEVHVEETTTAVCTIVGRRKGSERWTRVSWTLEDARRAGTKNMDRFPRQMLQARATTELARLVFPDVIAGLRSVEELEEETETVALPAAPSTETTTVARAPKKRPARKKAAAPVATPPEPDLPTDDDVKVISEAKLHSVNLVPADQVPEEQRVTVTPPEPDLPDEQPAPPPPEHVEDADEKTRAATRSQVGLIASHAKRLGFEDREERVQLVARIVQHDLESTKDLTVHEARAVIKVLEVQKTRDDLIAGLAAADRQEGER